MSEVNLILPSAVVTDILRDEFTNLHNYKLSFMRCVMMLQKSCADTRYAGFLGCTDRTCAHTMI